MSKTTNPITKQEDGSSSKDIKKMFFRVLSNWPYMLSFFLLSLIISVLINRYTSPIYVVSGSIVKSKDQSEGDFLFETKNPKIFKGENSDVEREKRILRSQKNISHTLDNLPFLISIYQVGEVKESEVYPNNIFDIEISGEEEAIPFGQKFRFIQGENLEEYGLFTQSSEFSERYLDGQEYKFGEWVSINGCKIKINRKEKDIPLDIEQYYFVLNRPSNLFSLYSTRLELQEDPESNQIFSLKIFSKTPNKDLLFLEEFINVALKENLDKKNKESSNSLKFIDEQLKVFLDTLSFFQGQIDSYKVKNLDFGGANELILQKVSELEVLKSQYNFQNNYLDYLESYVKERRDEEIFSPALIGMDAPILNQQVITYAEEKRNSRIFENEENKRNPMVQYQDGALTKLEEGILESVRTIRLQNKAYIKDLDNEIQFYINSLGGLQNEKRELYDILQMNSLVEQMVQLLLQKRTEISIKKSSTESDYEILDPPTISEKPFVPNKLKNILIACLIGLGFPIGFIYLKTFFSSKIHLREELEEISQIPILGDIGHSEHYSNLIFFDRPKSSISEGFRLIRSNIHFMTGNVEVPVIMVSSFISGEGKTFNSINLSLAFSQMGKKVLLIGGDMRRPKIFDDFPNVDPVGLSNYLAGEVDLSSIVQKSHIENLFLVASGDIPPNPSELLLRDKMDEAIKEWKTQYDSIIIDSPPMGLVTDAAILTRLTDLVIFIVRQGVTEKEMVKNIQYQYESGILEKMAFVLNDMKGEGIYRYGYHYGYYDDAPKRNFISKLFSKTKNRT